ncbi:hypothetical protein [Aliikangiella sp. IMCC44359]|uniref:hypothetical protein n=1 Tax=Aliikangiella sp. IMCC44359 TaxID=3459125 RepID=UPI00403AFA9D
MKTQTNSTQNLNSANSLRNNISDARTKWGKITQAEFTEMDGSSSKLTKLVESRYNINNKDAEKQVQEFIDLHQK